MTMTTTSPSPIPLQDPRTTLAIELMRRFADRTGLTGKRPPRRYLWTDAFAVCNFIALGRVTGHAAYRDLARDLVDQVHRVLGHHGEGDVRTGWISGLDDAAGALHPTIGGLRIGKPRPERSPAEPLVEREEIERDGQYFHYLTKWTLALERYGRALGDVQPLTWARELAATAQRAFTTGRYGARRMTWKMSIDLSRPLVDSMGQHDPIDGLVGCLELDAAADARGMPRVPSLERAISEYTALVDVRTLTTADPLGLGGLLVDALRLTRLAGAPPRLVTAMLEAAATGIEFYAGLHDGRPLAQRLAFRELGLVLGLEAVAMIDRDQLDGDARAAWARITRHAALRTEIEAFWMRPEHRASRSWSEHADINDVMLATCMHPEGFLGG